MKRKDPIFLGVDIGGTAVKLGMVNSAGQILKKVERSVSFDGFRTPIIETVVAAIRDFLGNGTPAPLGIGVSATGQIDAEAGVVAGTCGNLPGWEGTDIAGRLRREFALPVRVANDANCMCLGEVRFGAGRGFTDVVGVTIGTGIGGGIITGGHLLAGSRGLGGEIGHIRIHAGDGLPCTCGHSGCWEQYASTTALVREAKRRDPRLSDGRRIFEAARDGDPAADALIEDWIREIAAGLAGLVHLLNPQIILIGGGVSSQQERLIEPLAESVRNSVMPAFAKGLKIRAAKLKNDAGVVGAACLFL